MCIRDSYRGHLQLLWSWWAALFHCPSRNRLAWSKLIGTATSGGQATWWWWDVKPEVGQSSRIKLVRVVVVWQSWRKASKTVSVSSLAADEETMRPGWSLSLDFSSVSPVRATGSTAPLIHLLISALCIPVAWLHRMLPQLRFLFTFSLPIFSFENRPTHFLGRRS